MRNWEQFDQWQQDADALPDDQDDLRGEINRLRSALRNIGAMFYMDNLGMVEFKDAFDNESVLDAVNVALKE